METQNLTLTLKQLIGLELLTIPQAIRGLDWHNWQLRGAKVALIKDTNILAQDFITTYEIRGSGKLNKINELGEVVFTPDGGEEETVKLGTKIILIILKDDERRYVVFGKEDKK